MNIKTFTLSLAVLFVFFIIELVREEKLTFKYAFGWLLVSVMSILLVIFDKLLFNLAKFFGFELASNFIFFSILCGFIFLSLLLTIFLCQQNKRNDKMAQKIGMLESEIYKIKQKIS
jgi:hypothetical protein